jgi:hypothetical protein
MTTYDLSLGTRRPTALAVSLTAAAVVGPVLFLLGQALLPKLPEVMDRAYPLMVEHRDQLMAARLFTAAGAFLLAIAAVRYSRLVFTGRGVGLMGVGATLFGIGSFCNALSQAVAGYATWTVTSDGFDESSARYVIEHIESGAVALPLGFWSIPAFALGALLMAAALWRSGSAPTWLPVLLAVGTVLAAALAGQGPVVALTQAPVTAALVVMAVLAHHRDEDRSTGAH